MTTALTLPERAAVALGTAEHEIKLIALAKESADIVAVTNAAGREQAHRIGMNLRTTRTTIQKIGKDARDDATKFSKAIIAEEDRLICIIQPEEVRVIGLRDGFDAEEKARRDALIAAERARVDAIQADIAAIRAMPLATVGKSAEEIGAMIGRLANLSVGGAFEEFRADAAVARLESLDLLEKAETTQRNIEIKAESDRQEAARVAAQAKADREELAAAQARLKADQAEQAEIARLAKVESDRVAAALKTAQDELNAKVAAHEAKIASEARAAQKLIDDAAKAVPVVAEVAAEKPAAVELAEAQVNPEGVELSPAAQELNEEEGARRFAAHYRGIAPAAAGAPSLTLGKIGGRLGFSLTADFLRSIGFEPAGRERAAVLYHEDQWQAICTALVDHIDSARVIQQKAA